MERLIGIIADDLTGANDSGVQLAEKGIHTSVYFDIPQNDNNLDRGIVLDTDSRTLSKKEAYEVTKQAGQFLKDAGYPTIYKKMDSTLRGYVGTELLAMSEVFEPDFVFVAPAFPTLGRTTKQGVHYIYGKDLIETEIAKDPKHPVTESYIPALLEKEVSQPVGLIEICDIEDSIVFKKKLNAFKQSGIQFIVCDAESQTDLQRAAQQMVDVSNNIIWAGSAGLIEILPEVLGICCQREERIFLQSNQVMTVCGSLSEVTRSQVNYIIQHSGVFPVELNTVQIFEENWELHRQKIIDEMVFGLNEGKDLVLYVPSDPQTREDVKRVGAARMLTATQIGQKISDAIASVVSCVLQKYKHLSSLILTGGDTAKDTSRQIGGIGFKLVKQIEPGIPLGTLIGSDKEYTVVTKAGAFGNEKSFDKAIKELKGVHY